MLDDLTVERDLYAVPADSMLMLCRYDDVTMGTPMVPWDLSSVPQVYP